MGKVKNEEETFTFSSGRVITEKEIEEIVAEAEDAVDWPRVYPDRPSLDGNGESPWISFRVPQGLLAKAQRRADDEDRSVRDVSREALERFLTS